MQIWFDRDCEGERICGRNVFAAHIGISDAGLSEDVIVARYDLIDVQNERYRLLAPAAIQTPKCYIDHRHSGF